MEKEFISTLSEYKLSKREKEVIEILLLGKTNKELSEVLFVTEKTVKFHLTRIYKKLETKSRYTLLAMYSQFLLKRQGMARPMPPPPTPRTFNTPPAYIGPQHSVGDKKVWQA